MRSIHRKWDLDQRYRLLRDWYGADDARVEMAAHCPPAEELAPTVDKVLGAIRAPEVSLLVELHRRWAEIAGAEAVRWVQPGAVSNGIFVLEVRHSLLLREYAGCADLWVNRINEVFGRVVCARVRFVPAGRSGDRGWKGDR